MFFQPSASSASSYHVCPPWAAGLPDHGFASRKMPMHTSAIPLLTQAVTKGLASDKKRIYVGAEHLFDESLLDYKEHKSCTPEHSKQPQKTAKERFFMQRSKALASPLIPKVLFPLLLLLRTMFLDIGTDFYYWQGGLR